MQQREREKACSDHVESWDHSSLGADENNGFNSIPFDGGATTLSKYYLEQSCFYSLLFECVMCGWSVTVLSFWLCLYIDVCIFLWLSEKEMTIQTNDSLW